MITSPMLLIHISGAVIGLLSGAMSMLFRKGSGLHGAAGNVFFVSMLVMSSSAAYVAQFERPNAVNFMVGVLTFYLVSTSWVTARRREGSPGMFDWIALAVVLADGLAGWVWGFEAAASPNGMKDHMPAALYFIFGTIALLCARSDIRLLRAGGITGPARISRHLGRMGLAFAIALLSFYPGQARLFPMWLKETKLLFIPHILLIGSLIYWLVKMRRARKRAPSTLEARPLTPLGTWTSNTVPRQL